MKQFKQNKLIFESFIFDIKTPKFCVSDILLYCKDSKFEFAVEVKQQRIIRDFPMFHIRNNEKFLITDIFDKYDCHDIQNESINKGKCFDISTKPVHFVYKLFHITTSSELYFTDAYCEEIFKKLREY